MPGGRLLAGEVRLDRVEVVDGLGSAGPSAGSGQPTTEDRMGKSQYTLAKRIGRKLPADAGARLAGYQG
jgi:hypothetical protein